MKKYLEVNKFCDMITIDFAKYNCAKLTQFSKWRIKGNSNKRIYL